MSSSGIIDIGVNLAGPAYLSPGKVSAVVDGCRAANVTQIVCISNDITCSRASTVLTQEYPGFAYCTAGLHPKEAGQVKEADLERFVDELREIVMTTAGCVAIGECGLNCSSPTKKPKSVQLRVFRAQVLLAKELGAPLYLHSRNAFAPMIEELKKAEYFKGIVHCFTGTAAQARELVALGVYIGVTGWLLDEKRNADLVQALREGAIPLDKLLVETDAPWLSVDPTRQAVPADTWQILEVAAALMGVEFETARVAVCENFRRLFEFEC